MLGVLCVCVFPGPQVRMVCNAWRVVCVCECNCLWPQVRMVCNAWRVVCVCVAVQAPGQDGV